MKGKEALLLLMEQFGVEYVFGIPGATEIFFMDALEKSGKFHYILSLHEVVCVGMAEGYARASGKPAFLNLHTGPGTAAAMPMLVNAMNGRVPMVVTVGQNDSRLLQYDPQLSGDIIGMAGPVTKWCAEIWSAEDLPAVMRRAFKMAMQAPCGPVLVSLPSDVLEQELTFESRSATEVYPRLRPDADALDKAVSLIKDAKAPVMLVQEGVARSGALDETVKLAETLGAPVYQAWMGDVNFPVGHPLYRGDIDTTGPVLQELLQKSDLLVGVGCQLFNDAFYSGRKILPDGVKVIQINDDPWEIGKNFPVDCGLLGDVKTSLEELNILLAASLSGEYRREANARALRIKEETDRAKSALRARIEAEESNSPIAVTHLMETLRKVLPENYVVVDDCWSSSQMLRHILEPSETGSYIKCRNGGSIGFGLPGGMGVKLGNPDKKVVVVSGDGSAAWSMQSFWTAAHYKIPVVFIVTNNATYRQVKVVRRIILGDYPLNERHDGMELTDPVISFCGLAEAQGVKGFAVRDPAELEATLKTALELDEPVLVEVFIENSAK